MLLRLGNALPRIIATLMAVVAVSLSFAMSDAQHAPQLHVAALAGHAHGHSHDFDEVVAGDKAADDHHHADHTHEKADLVAPVRLAPRSLQTLAYFSFADMLEGKVSDGVERPPRRFRNIV